MDLYIEHLLQPFGLDLAAKNQRVKLVRHKDAALDIERLRNDGEFEAYQRYQAGPVFANLDSIVSFIGGDGTLATFEGVYSVGVQSGPGVVPPMKPFSQGFDASTYHHFDLKRQDGFDELQDRVVIDWGKGALAWHQHFRPMEKRVVEVLPKEYVRNFPGYLDFVLSFADLERIVKNPVANREWERALKAVAGVYLILDTGTGKQYVGSAYGEGGILGRWKTYVETRHGDNKLLKELLVADTASLARFQFSLLQTLSRSLTQKEVIAVENMHKRKLGSRAHGLNAN